MFTLAHLSDVHLPPMPIPSVGQILNKRLIGLNSWAWNRRKIHNKKILNAIISDIIDHNPQHIALTGDVVNIALPQEFVAAKKWLRNFAPSEQLTFIPGNHDTYVKQDWQQGLGYLAEYMTGDLRIANSRLSTQVATPFPFVRTRRNIALIGLSSAIPAPWKHATGQLGVEQLTQLAQCLDALRTRGYYRIVLIHHPPLPGLAKQRKCLLDAEDMRETLKRHGAELVLHGHNHIHMRNQLDTITGPCHILAPSSASARATHNRPAGSWYHYTIERKENRFICAVKVRGYDEKTNAVIDVENFKLEHP